MMKALLLARELQSRFKEKYSTCRCYDIQTKFHGRFFDMTQPSEMEAAVKAGLVETCSNLVGEGARIAAELILEQKDKDTAKQT